MQASALITHNDWSSSDPRATSMLFKHRASEQFRCNRSMTSVLFLWSDQHRQHVLTNGQVDNWVCVLCSQAAAAGL